MIRKRQLLTNALASVIQVVVTSIAFFVLYRYIKDHVGIEDFGVWALVLATTSASSIANLGLATGAVKFVSMYLARGQEQKVVQVVQTAVISIAVFLGIVLLGLYPLLERVIGFFLEPAEKLPVAHSILPYALLSFWLSSVAAVLLSCVDGHQRIDLRSGLSTINILLYLVFAFVLVPAYGLTGLVQAQVLQAGLLLVASWFLLKHLVPALPVLPYRWSRTVFSEMLGYSLNFQVISASQLLFEPVTKALLSKFGGVAALGYFEFAHRMVFQLRTLIVAAHQSIVPTIADVQERQPELIRDIYTSSYRLLLYLILPSLPLLIALTPLISRLWIGLYEPTFVLFAILLFVGWFVNITSGPAYFANLGTGQLRWNVWGHVVIGLLNIGLGGLLGWQYGGPGVVVGFVIALLTGSLVIAVAYERTHRIPLADLFQRESVLLGTAGLAGMALALLLYGQLKSSLSLIGLTGLVLGAYAAVVAGPLWLHPVRRQLHSWVTHLFLQRRPRSQSVEP